MPRLLKNEKEVPQAPEQRFPYRPWRRPRQVKLSPCSPWGSTVEQISTCSPRRIPRWSRWMPEGGCDPMENPLWSRLLPGPVDPWSENPC